MLVAACPSLNVPLADKLPHTTLELGRDEPGVRPIRSWPGRHRRYRLHRRPSWGLYRRVERAGADERAVGGWSVGNVLPIPAGILGATSAMPHQPYCACSQNTQPNRKCQPAPRSAIAGFINIPPPGHLGRSHAFHCPALPYLQLSSSHKSKASRTRPSGMFRSRSGRPMSQGASSLAIRSKSARIWSADRSARSMGV